MRSLCVQLNPDTSAANRLGAAAPEVVHMMIVGFSLKRLILLITFPKIPNLHLNKTSPFQRHWETFSACCCKRWRRCHFPQRDAVGAQP